MKLIIGALLAGTVGVGPATPDEPVRVVRLERIAQLPVVWGDCWGGTYVTASVNRNGDLELIVVENVEDCS